MSQAMSVSELFPIVLNYFLVSFEQLKKYIQTSLKLLIPYTIAFVVLNLLSALVGGIAGVSVASNPSGFSDGGSTASMAGLAVAGVLGILLTILGLLMIPFAIYFSFCLIRFVINSNQQDPHTLGTTNLWAFNETFWGYLGLVGLLFLIAIPAMIAIGIGFLCLVIPGWAMLGLFSAYSYSACFSYLENPSAGVSVALGKALEMVKADWQRWLILSLLLGLTLIALYIIMIPVSVICAFIPFASIGLNLLMSVVSPIISMYYMYLYYHCYKDTHASTPNQQLA